MLRLLRMLGWLGILLVIGLAAAGARMAWLAGWPQLSQPPVVNGVLKDSDRADWEQASTKLSVVLKRTFPVGSAAQEVIVRLRGQGFVPLAQCPDAVLHKVQGSTQDYACSENWDPDHALHYNWGPRQPCQQDVAVFWTDDSNGRVASIEGEYSCS